MDKFVYIIDGRGTRQEICSQSLNVVSFTSKYHVYLHDGLRTPLYMTVISPTGEFVVKIKDMAALPPEKIPMIEPGSALIVGERPEAEKDQAKLWVQRYNSSSEDQISEKNQHNTQLKNEAPSQNQIYQSSPRKAAGSSDGQKHGENLFSFNQLILIFMGVLLVTAFVSHRVASKLRGKK